MAQHGTANDTAQHNQYHNPKPSVKDEAVASRDFQVHQTRNLWAHMRQSCEPPLHNPPDGTIIALPCMI